MPPESWKGNEPSGTGITDGREPPNMGAGNQTQESSKAEHSSLQPSDISFSVNTSFHLSRINSLE